MLRAVGVMWANDCHQLTFLTARRAARILIMNLRHRHALPLTRPAILLGEDRPDTRERRKSSIMIRLSRTRKKRQMNLVEAYGEALPIIVPLLQRYHSVTLYL